MVDAIDADARIPFELTWAGQDAADSDDSCACYIVLRGDMAVCKYCETGYYLLSDIEHHIREQRK